MRHTVRTCCHMHAAACPAQCQEERPTIERPARRVTTPHCSTSAKLHASCKRTQRPEHSNIHKQKPKNSNKHKRVLAHAAPESLAHSAFPRSSPPGKGMTGTLKQAHWLCIENEPGGNCQSQGDRERSHEGYACVERSKAEGIKHRAGALTHTGLGCCHKGHTIAPGPEPTHTKHQPAKQDVRTGLRAVSLALRLRLRQEAQSRHVEHGLPTTPPRPTSPLANNSCLTTDSSGILATRPKRVSRAALRMCVSWGTPAAAHI
eukprot:365277-Chlamydomonas_euryale.AAC.4